MTRKLWPLRIVLAVAASLCAGCGTLAPAPRLTGPQSRMRPFSQLVVFGDSLSDTGNVKLEFGVVPQWPYAGGRFSNGEVWVEHLAQHFGLSAEPSYIGGTNFAHGQAGTAGGLSELGPLPVSPNITGQVQLYAGYPDGSELFVVWGGANDLFDIVSGGADIPPDEAARNVATVVHRLYDRGARAFVVPNIPDLGATPRYRSRHRQQQATALTLAFNAALRAALDELESLPGIMLYRVDIYAEFQSLLAAPPPGVINTTDRAYSGDFYGLPDGGQVVSNPDGYLFWDFVHPTRTGHRLIAETAIETIERTLESIPPNSNAHPDAPAFIPPQLAFWFYYWSNFAAGLRDAPSSP